jgi:hypothetical protein
LTAKFKTLRLRDKAADPITVESEKFTVADPPPDTLTRFTWGEVAVGETLTLTIMTG